ncbi:MAG: PAS domain S-box-containing protein, partial [Planctomycetota bacterium]
MTAIRRSDEDKTANADMLTMAVIGVFYPFALLLGSSLKFGADNIPLILPASGVLLGLFLCCHYSRWPYLILFTGLSQFITDQILPVDSSAEFITTLGASLIESIGVALLIRWSLKSFLDIEKAAHILEYFLLTAVFSTAVASFLRTDLHNLIFASPSYWQFWLNNWMPALTGIVVITPVLLAWIRQRSSDPSPVTQARRLECATLFLTTIIASAGISSVASSSFVQAPNYSFLVLGTLVWASLRMRPVVALLNMLMSAFIIILNSSQGNGPYALNSFEPQNLDLQLYLCSAALITLLTSTLLSRLRRNEAELSISSEARRTAMEAIHQCSWHYDKDLNLVAWDSGVGGDYSLSGNEKIGYPLLDDLEYWARQGSHGEGNAKEIARRRLQQYRDGTIPSYETRANNKRGTLEIRRYRMPDGGYTETQNDITEQLKAEEMARKNEPLFKAFLSNTPGLITIKNLDGCYSHMSDEFYDLFNLTPDRVIGHYPDEIFKPDLAKLIEEGDLAIINSGIAWQKEIYIETPKGRKDFYTVQFPVIDNSGKMLAIGGIATDISQFKQQQRSLQNSEQEYRELVEGSIQGIYIYDANQMLFVNQACAEIFGYASPAEVIALETRFQLYANYEYERLASYAERRLRGENPPASYEFDGVRKDGSIIRLSTLVRRVHWKGNDALQTVVVDVTREKRAAENMRHSEIRYRSLFDLAPIALQEQDWSRAKSLIDRLTAEGVEDIRSYLNKNPRLIYKLGDVLEIRGINQTALQMFQAPDKATYTNWIHNVPCAPFREEILDRLDNLSQGIRHYNNESTSVRMNGDTFPVLITSTLVSDDADDWSQIYISIIDLTSLNEALAQQRESELRYRRLFNLAPIALYVQDFSKGRKILDDLRKQGIDDIQSHLEHNPGLLSSNNSVSSFLNANQEVLRLYQFADMNLFKTWLSNDFSPEGHSRMVERLLRFNSGERKVSVETTATRFNGERFPILQTIEIVGDDESDWSRVYTTIQDLTERHKAEVELRDSEQKFRNLAEGSLQGIAVFDLNWD